MAAYETNIPGSSIYAGAALLAKTAYQKALARLNEQRGTTIRQAGFKANINPETGLVEGLGVDQSSMYGDFQQLNRQQAQQDEQSRYAAQERGLGAGGGLAAQLRNNVRYGFGKQDADFGTGLQSTLAGYADQQVQAGQSRDAALYEAQLAAAREAQQNALWSPTDYGDMETPVYGDPGPTGGTGVTGVKAGGAVPGVNYGKNSFYAPVAPKPAPAPKKKILPPPKKATSVALKFK